MSLQIVGKARTRIAGKTPRVSAGRPPRPSGQSPHPSSGEVPAGICGGNPASHQRAEPATSLLVRSKTSRFYSKPGGSDTFAGLCRPAPLRYFLLAQKVAKNAIKGEGEALSLNKPSPDTDTQPCPPEQGDTLYQTNLSSNRVSFWGDKSAAVGDWSAPGGAKLCEALKMKERGICDAALLLCFP